MSLFGEGEGGDGKKIIIKRIWPRASNPAAVSFLSGVRSSVETEGQEGGAKLTRRSEQPEKCRRGPGGGGRSCHEATLLGNLMRRTKAKEM